VLTRRIIVCLDMAVGRVVKGTKFEQLRDVGDPAELAARYERDSADEIVLLDVAAYAEGRRTMLDVVRRAADNLSVPLTVGGGIRTIEDVRQLLRSGADKSSINSAAVDDPFLISRAADQFGSQCVVVSIDARLRAESWRVYTHGGSRVTGLDVVEWARECAARGAGELLVTSVDRDGMREGYDLDLLRAVRAVVRVPVVASGGAGTGAHVVAALGDGAADAALVAGIVHDGLTTVRALKAEVAAAGIPTRLELAA
jgi:imidazole glycerol-phosphate synthase subunit HisF